MAYDGNAFEVENLHRLSSDAGRFRTGCCLVGWDGSIENPRRSRSLVSRNAVKELLGSEGGKGNRTVSGPSGRCFSRTVKFPGVMESTNSSCHYGLASGYRFQRTGQETSANRCRQSGTVPGGILPKRPTREVARAEVPGCHQMLPKATSGQRKPNLLTKGTRAALNPRSGLEIHPRR
jgi:hypothetical protein